MPDKSSLKSLHRLMYGMGEGGIQILSLTVLTWIMYCYAPPAGRGLPLISLQAVGLALTVGRLVGASTNLWIGFWSDNSSHKLGRRIPFLLFSGLPLVLVFMALWKPPIQDISSWNTVYLTILICLFYFLSSLYHCPHNALIVDMAKNPKEQITLSTSNATFAIVGSIIVAVSAGPLIEIWGFQITGIVLGMLSLFFLYAPIMAVRERIDSLGIDKDYSLKNAITDACCNKPFRVYMYCTFLYNLSLNTFLTALPYWLTVILKGTLTQVGLFMGVHLITNLVVFPFMIRFTVRAGIYTVLKNSLFANSLLFTLYFFIGKVIVPFSLLTQGLFFMVITAIPMSAIYALQGAFIANIIEQERMASGFKRSAMYFGMIKIVKNASVAVSAFLVSTIFTLYGYYPGNNQGIYIIGLVCATLFFLSFLVLRATRDGRQVEAIKR